MFKVALLLSGILFLNGICFARDKPCDEACQEKVFTMCLESQNGYGISLDDLIKFYGKDVKKITADELTRIGLCAYAVYFNEISKESYAKYVIPTLKYYLRRGKEYEFEDLASNLNEHMEEPGIPDVERSIKVHISEYSQEYRKVYENEYFNDALKDAKRIMRLYQ